MESSSNRSSLPSGAAGAHAVSGVDAGHADIAYSREMGVTHRDFHRILPKAMGAHDYRMDGDTVRGTIEGGSVEIHLGEEQMRRIALMAIPYAVVSFTFRNVSAEAQRAFKKHFDLYFQRGGG